ncbi:hypothetical protein BCR34DRAFT_602337 [Clohesyomyces aquaticus]|uniref:Non-haem dioxygenase N-terminal domain-containing protein n=1 Tax=Clohesyomyces aquaticus TaxID=1231657 RepID=A0A1Y1ZIN9_9PLEO|nr:hypothetical protein BCR34DRAFT_602337 [Clohesyomyces aquaticus]
MTAPEQEYVYYHVGGKRGSRPVLRGSAAKDTFESIPFVDVSGLFSSSPEDRKKVANEIGKAWVISDTFETVKKFFAMPIEDKMELHLHKSKGLRGYEPLFETRLEGTGREDMKEAFTIGDDPWEPEQTAPTPRPFGTQAQLLAARIPVFPSSNDRGKDAKDIGLGAHTDYSFFTLVHRVLDRSGEERYSMPFFFSPNREAMLEVVPTCRGEGEKSEPVNAGNYFIYGEAEGGEVAASE